MPLTPHFELSQTITHVTVDIRVPHVRVSVDTVEILVDESTLHFSSPPYLLVLTFPAALVEEEEKESAKYDPIKNGGMVSVTCAKQEPVIWPDLDLMGKLVVAPKQRMSHRRGGIEILDESSHDVQQDDSNDEDAQEQTTPILDIRNVLGPRYGFLNMHSGVFTDLAREGLAAEMLELPNPDTTSPQDRRKLRLEKEEHDFDGNRYLGDLEDVLVDDYIFQTAMAMKPHWQRHSNEETTTDTPFFTQEESAQLASIPYPLLSGNISLEQDESLLLGILDILFAYVYDHIMTDGDPTIESSWTVCILSSTLSWLDEFDSLEQVVRHAIRRALVYPYLRNYELALYCWNQVACILKQTRRCIIRCLLQVHNVLNKSECHYLGNRLFMDPYLAWIQRHVTDAQVSSLCTRLEVLLKEAETGKVLQKESLGLNLLALEQQVQDGYDNDESTSSDESGSDNDESSEEESLSSDDSTDSFSTDTEKEISTCNDQRPASTSLLDDEIGGSSMVSIEKRLENLNLQMDTKAKEPKKLIEELS